MQRKARVSEGTGHEEKERQAERNRGREGDEALMEAGCKGGNGEEESVGGYGKRDNWEMKRG